MLGALFTPATMGIVGAVIAVIIVVSLIIKRYRIVDPDTAMIIVGNRGKRDDAGNIDLSGQKVITGGGAFVWPFIQKPFEISLRSRRLTLTTTGQTQNGITLQAQAVAVIKVGGSEEMIRAAAQRFLSQQDEIEISAQEILSGSLRSILGSLTVTKIIQDRQAVAGLVLQAAEEALSKQGLTIDTLQIQEIKDSSDYISNIGRPEAAKVRQAAEIADTEASRSSEEARIEAEKIILDKNRELRLQEAAVQSETDKALAMADAAKPLEQAQQQRLITEQETITAQKEAELQEQKLNATVRKEADAEAYRITTLANAQREAQIAKAQAEQEEREALAQAARVEGESAAAVIQAKGTAEAEAIAARAEALSKQGEAVLAQQLIELLPSIAKELASAYGSIDNLTVVSADGANKLSGDVVGNMAGMTEMLKDTVGIDLTSLITGRATGHAIGEGLGSASGPEIQLPPRLGKAPEAN